MNQREILPVGRDEAQFLAAEVIEKTYACRVIRIKYVGGGSFGFVYKAQIDRQPFTLIMKACRTQGVCEREAGELKLLGSDSLIKIPEVYFTFTATDEIPVDFIGMEYIEGTNCFTDFLKLLNSGRAKKRFADEVTGAMRHWHEKTNDKFGLIGNAVYDEWLDYYRPFAAEVLESARELNKNGRLEKNVLDAMDTGGYTGE